MNTSTMNSGHDKHPVLTVLKIVVLYALSWGFISYGVVLSFPQAYDDMNEAHWAFIRRREADCARGTAYALRSAAIALAAK